ncbi:MAG: P27 family phage terminase small subunit [Methylophilaceae bacterium]
MIENPPEPPDWIVDKNAKKEWNRLVPILIANGLLTEGGLSALAIMCGMHGKIVGLFEIGATPTGFMIAQYRALMNDFGLTPSSQSKVTSISPAKSNTFENNGNRKH